MSDLQPDRYDWLPIDTAPKDGSRIMVWSMVRGGVAVFARFDDNRHAAKPRPYWRTDTFHIDGMAALRNQSPTHWQPCPLPPVTSEI